jgi:hypothetical protein
VCGVFQPYGRFQEVLMTDKIPSDEEVKKFIDASDDLMKLGIGFSHNIGLAFLEFRQHLDMMMRTNFVEKAVIEMLSDSFTRMEAKVKTNLESIDSIYQEGGQWYSFYIGRAIRKNTDAPPAWHRQDIRPADMGRDGR